MPIAIFSAPQQVQTPWPVDQAVKFDTQLTWTGWNGESFDLRHGRSGVTCLLENVEGLLNPPVELRTTASPARGGSRYRGITYKQREVMLPLFVYTRAGSDEWMELNDRFWRSWHPDHEGILSVTTPRTGTRRLGVRFTDDGGSLPRDPIKSGWARYPIAGLATQPFWLGDPQYRNFRQSVEVGGPGPGRPIASGAGMASASIMNPGDMPSYPQYRITGPTTDVVVGVVGPDDVQRTVRAPFQIPAGMWVLIDTVNQTVVDSNGANRRRDLSPKPFFSPIQPGENVRMFMSMYGQGQVEVWLTPRFLRAF